MALIVDTGPLFASLDRLDPDHASSLQLLRNFPEDLVVPSPVLVELDQLLSRRQRSVFMAAFFDDVTRGNYVIEDLIREDYLRASHLIRQYADANIGFVDAAVMAVVERLEERKLATLDRRHFGFMRPRHVDSLQLLPE